jgi:hypothetical protein
VSEPDYKAKYTSLLRQTEPVIRAIEDVVPQRIAGLHPNLIYLFDMAQAWRNTFDAEDDPAEVTEAWAVMERAEAAIGSDTIALLATLEAMRLMLVSGREDYQQKGREGLVSLMEGLAGWMRSRNWTASPNRGHLRRRSEGEW